MVYLSRERLLNAGLEGTMSSPLGIQLLGLITDQDYNKICTLLADCLINLDERDENGETFLMVAARVGNAKIVEVLVSQEDININAVDNDNWTALLNASKVGNPDIVRNLCDRGANVEHSDLGGWTALMWSCYKGRSEAVEILLENGANPNVKGDHFVSCLTWACGRGYSPIVESLLSNGAKVNTADKYGSTPLIWACRRGHTEIVRLLIEEGANIDNAGMNSWTALIACAKGGYEACVALLLEKHPNTNAVDKDGFTALTWASKDGFCEIATMLVHHGAYVNLQDREGDSILIHAVKGANYDLVTLLLRKYADVNILGNADKTALYWAVEKNLYMIAKQLISFNASLEIPNKDGDTALIKATRTRNLDLVRILLDKGAKVSATDKRGDTALHISLRAQSKRIVEQLLRNPKDGKLLYRPNRDGVTPYQIDSSQKKSIVQQVLGARNLNNDDFSKSGYDLYSATIADVLSEPALRTPITVGLYAKWGSGKSILIEKLLQEMRNFTTDNVERFFAFTWLQLFTFLLVSVFLGVVLGVATSAKFGIGLGLTIFFGTYVFLLIVYYCNNHWYATWANLLSKKLFSNFTACKLLLQVVFCNEPEPPAREVVAVKFMFTNNARLASVVGEKSISTMIATLSTEMEKKYGRVVTRLYRVFAPEKASRHGRYKSICCIPYFFIAFLVMICFLVALVLLETYGFRDFATLDHPTESAFIIVMLTVVGIAIVSNAHTLIYMMYALAYPTSSRVKHFANTLETLKMEGFVQRLKQEVELMANMTLALDAFLSIHTRLVVIVDGLDSCDQEKLLMVLDTVNMLFSGTRPFITILAVDPHVIIKGIEHNLHGLFRDSSITGHDYLRNIVHLPFFIQSQVLKPVVRRGTEIDVVSDVNHKASVKIDAISNEIPTRERLNTLLSSQTNLNKLDIDVGHRDSGRRSGTQSGNVLENNTYFSDVNPRSVKRLMNIVSVTGRLLRAQCVEFNWLKLAAWINLTEQWPYRLSWMILEIEDNKRLKETMPLEELYSIVNHKIPVSKAIDPLLEIDRNVQKLEVFLSSCHPRLCISDVRKLLPCTINVDPYLRKLIRELQAKTETQLLNAQNAIEYPATPLANQMAAHVQSPDAWYNTQRSIMARGAMSPPIMQNPQNMFIKPVIEDMESQEGGVEVDSSLPMLSVMKLNDVCTMITSIDGLAGASLRAYMSAVRENNLTGTVLMQCDLSELKPVMKMNFGDWELFRSYVEAMRLREVTGNLNRNNKQTESRLSKPVRQRRPMSTLMTDSNNPDLNRGLDNKPEGLPRVAKKRDSIVGLAMKESAALVEAFRDYDNYESLDEEEPPAPLNDVQLQATPKVRRSKDNGAVEEEPAASMGQVNDSLTSIPKAIYTIDSQGPASPRSVRGSFHGNNGTEMKTMVQQADEIMESNENDHLL